MKLFIGIVASLIACFLMAFMLQAVIEAFTDQDQPLWVYLTMAALAHYIMGLNKAE